MHPLYPLPRSAPLNNFVVIKTVNLREKRHAAICRVWDTKVPLGAISQSFAFNCWTSKFNFSLGQYLY